MTSGRTLTALPYVAGLFVAAALFYFAGSIQYTAREGQLGPDFWPKLAIGLMAAVCLFEIVRIAVTGGGPAARGVADALDQATEAAAPAATYPGLLAGGIALTFAYGLLIGILGFLVATFVFLLAFMYLGRYRSHGVIWIASAVGMVVVALIFLKVVYVSLPRGVPPFDRVTDFVARLF
jgi:putative tricarboxylic transport membrane protein